MISSFFILPFLAAVGVLWSTWISRKRIFKKIRAIANNQTGLSSSTERKLALKEPPLQLTASEIAFLRARGDISVLARAMAAQLALKYGDQPVIPDVSMDAETTAEIALHNRVIQQALDLRTGASSFLLKPILGHQPINSAFSTFVTTCYRPQTRHIVQHLSRNRTTGTNVRFSEILHAAEAVSWSAEFHVVRERLIQTMIKRRLLLPPSMFDHQQKQLQELSKRPIRLTSYIIWIPIFAISLITNLVTGNIFGSLALIPGVMVGLSIYGIWLTLAWIPASLCSAIIDSRESPSSRWLPVLSAIAEAPGESIQTQLLRTVLPLLCPQFNAIEPLYKSFAIGIIVLVIWAMLSSLPAVFLCTIAAMAGFILQAQIRNEARLYAALVPTPIAQRAMKHSAAELEKTSSLLALCHYSESESTDSDNTDSTFAKLVAYKGTELMLLLEKH